MATFVLEDLAAAIEVMVFPKTMLQYGELLDADAIVVREGPRRRPRRHAEAHGDGDHPARDRPRRRPAGARCGCKAGVLTDERVAAAARAPAPRTPATARCSCALVGPEKETVLRLGDEFRCDARNGLFAELRVLFGADCIG